MTRVRSPRRRPMLTAPEPIGGLVGRVKYGSGPRERPNVSREVWAGAVGARIAERAQPVELDKGTLIVRVATSVWASELSLLSVTILARLRAAGVEVSGMRCRVGAVEVPPQAHAKERRISRAVPSPQPIPGGLAEVLARVDDAELRATISAAASANLAWQAYVGSDGGGEPTDGGSRAARVPLSAERGTDPQARRSPAGPGAPRRTP